MKKMVIAVVALAVCVAFCGCAADSGEGSGNGKTVAEKYRGEWKWESGADPMIGSGQVYLNLFENTVSFGYGVRSGNPAWTEGGVLYEEFPRAIREHEIIDDTHIKYHDIRRNDHVYMIYKKQ